MHLQRKANRFSPVRLIMSIGFFILMIMGFSTRTSGEENSPPSVKITMPANNSTFHWSSDVRYAIRVSDKEDGNSDYDEIANLEVILHVRYLSDSSQAFKYRNDKVREEEPLAITLMKTTTCFNCHASRSKLIGPSFDRITLRYAYDETVVNILTSKVIQGSVNTWSEVPMPPNPDLKQEEIKQIIRWILKNNRNPNEFYLAGLNGTFRIKEKAKNDTPKGVYILTASYIDHGLEGNPSVKERGQHTIILKPS